MRPAPAQRIGPLVSVSAASVTQAITSTVNGLQYELVDIELAARGLLRITIDRRPGLEYPGDPGEFITVHDCERVTRQLQYVLEVEGADYARLEVSSPGLDRPLKTEGDYERFAGEQVALTLKLPFEGRKNWRGQLARDAEGWHLQVVDGKNEQRLGFTLAEVREARLVPVLNFKGRQSAPAVEPTDATTSNE
jgi:ribosome maturation factor RimP